MYEAIPRSDIAGSSGSRDYGIRGKGESGSGWELRPERRGQWDPNDCFGFLSIYARRHSHNPALLLLKVWVLLASEGCHPPPKLHTISHLIAPILVSRWGKPDGIPNGNIWDESREGDNSPSASYRWVTGGAKGRGVALPNILFHKNGNASKNKFKG